MTSSAEQKKQSDFRYETGDAAVPWRAVGEPVTSDDITRLVEFLIQPAAGKAEAYRKQLANVRTAIEALAAEGEYAGKLSLGQNVKKLYQVLNMTRRRFSAFESNLSSIEQGNPRNRK